MKDKFNISETKIYTSLTNSILYILCTQHFNLPLETQVLTTYLDFKKGLGTNKSKNYEDVTVDSSFKTKNVCQEITIVYQFKSNRFRGKNLIRKTSTY